MTIHSSRRSLRIAIVALAASAMISLSGCSLSGTAPESSTLTTATISGKGYGGRQPIHNATVTLYAAGTSGYGSAGTALATTSTDQNGVFQFTPGTPNPGPGLTSTWTCPTTTPASDPQIYMILSGGNSLGGSTANSAIALIAALGPCSRINTNTFVLMTEITSAATVYALAQYINPGTTAGTESIGTNGVNYTATGTTPQGAIGLNNAVAGIVNLATQSIGAVVTSTTYTGTASNVSGVTVTATPNSAKLITIADMLASCINTTSATSNNCADLFNNAVPPPSAAVTSQPSATFGTAVDTIQAAYYLAVNPTNNSSTAFSAGSCNNTPTAANRGTCLFGLASASAPFQGGLTGTPNDWTIGVTYSSTSNCTYSGTRNALFISGPDAAAVDANGNLWFNNAADPAGTVLYSAFSEISPTGQPLFCAGSSSSTGYENGKGITIDPTGNLWVSYNFGTKLLELIYNPTTLAYAATTTGWTTPTETYDVVSDGNGNIFYLTNAGASSYVLPYGSTNASSSWITMGYAPGASTTYIAADGLGRLWFQGETATSSVTVVYPETEAITGYSVAGGVVTFAAANTFTVGQTVTVAGLTTTEGLTFNHQNFVITAANTTSFSAATSAATIGNTTDTGSAFISVPTSSSGSLTTPYVAGKSTTLTATSYGIAIDNSNYGYTGTTCCNQTTDEELTKITSPAGPGSSSVGETFTSSSEYFAGSTGSRSQAVDGAGNVWFGMLYPETGTISNPATTDVYGVGEYTTTGSGTTATFTALSPSGSTPANCTSTVGTPPPQCPVNGGFQDANLLASYALAVDPSGNVWVLNSGQQVNNGTTNTFTYNGTSITEFIGAAVPVVTPTALGLKNGTQGTKP